MYAIHSWRERGCDNGPDYKEEYTEYAVDDDELAREIQSLGFNDGRAAINHLFEVYRLEPVDVQSAYDVAYKEGVASKLDQTVKAAAKQRQQQDAKDRAEFERLKAKFGDQEIQDGSGA